MNAIVNVSPNWGIGINNDLLVHVHADMRRFRALTLHNTVIFGRKTLDTFPNGDPLPKRNNIVLTRDPEFQKEGLTVCHDLIELKDAISGIDPEKVFVCGGEQIYRLLLPYCSSVILTLTEVYLPADKSFPNLNRMRNWMLTNVGERQTEDGIAFRYLTYRNTDTKSL